MEVGMHVELIFDFELKYLKEKKMKKCQKVF